MIWITYNWILGSIAFPFVGLLIHSVVGVVAVWAALGRPHWFVRIAVVGGLLSLGLAIPAHDQVLLFLTQSVVAIGVLWWVARRGRWQFSLSDLLLSAVVAAAAAALAADLPSDFGRWWSHRDLLLGGFLGVSTLDDLVPDYLPEVPDDPFGGGPLVYRRTATGYLLYSVGRDQRDDGGRPGIHRFAVPGDIVLDDPADSIPPTSSTP